MGLHEKTAILAGIIVPKSAMMLKYMDSSVAGVSVPKSLIDRMNKAKEAAGDDKKKARELQEQEGIKITIELIHQVLETPGRKGRAYPGHRMGERHRGDREGSGAVSETAGVNADFGLGCSGGI